MTWNGTDISDVPTLIYHDELTDKPGFDGSGTLLCTSRRSLSVSWSYPDNIEIGLSDSSQSFLHLQSGNLGDPPIRARLSRNPSNPITTPRTDRRANGLWRCFQHKGPKYSLGSPIHVAIYARVPGEL